MSPRWTVYGAVVSDWHAEEMLNDCFADLIEDSLTYDATFLNFLLDRFVQFEDSARVIATDQEPLPTRPTGPDRKVDITIADDTKIVGIESKRRDSLSMDQLSDELKKLEYNADNRDVHLIAITEHLRRPETIDQIPGNVDWTSWFRIAQRTFDARDLNKSWQPTVSRAQNMFREFGYSEFNGIDDEEFQVTVWELWKQIATQVQPLETGQRWPHKLLRQAASGDDGWRPIDPDWMLLTYGNSSRGQPSRTCYAVLSNQRTREVWVGLSIRPNGNIDLQNILCENNEIFANIVLDKDMEVIQFPLSWLVGRKNLPPEHNKAVSAARPATQSELAKAFADRRGMEHDGANRFVLGYQLNSDDILEEAIGYFDRLDGLFGTDDGPALKQVL